MKIWLLEPSVAAEMRAARDAGLAPTAEQQAAYETRERAAVQARDGVPRNLSVAGDVAEIRVEGVLTEKLDFFAFLFGGGNTTYQSIRSAIAAAEEDPNVKRVVYMIASPGGTVEGLFETLAAIDAATKPATVRASQATSAAYAIAAVAGRITATTPAALFGSIGVAASFLNLEEIIDITNTASPDKRPDLSTEEGKAVIRRELDGIFEVFADAIAQGRGTTVEDVADNFGRGAVLVAKEAKKLGMIDSVPGRVVRGARADAEHVPVAITVDDVIEYGATPEQTEPSAQARGSEADPKPAASAGDQKRPTASATQGGAATGRKYPMTKEELRAQHPEIYTAVLNEGETIGHAKGKAEGLEQGRTAGHEEGVKDERERVEAHLTLGKSCGAMDIALKYIGSGESTLNQKVHAEYLSAAMDKRDSDNRQADSDAVGAVVDGRAHASDQGKSEDELLDDEIEAIMDGKKVA